MVKINGMEFTLGCDPEVFIKNQNTYLCAEGMVKGTKKNPHKILNGMVQVDGMALEFGIDPVKTEKGFVHRVQNVFNRVQNLLPPDVTVDPSNPCVTFEKDIFDKASKESKRLGCDPDYNAYTGKLNPAPNPNVNFRTTSGHIHVGWTRNMDPNDPTHFMACRMLAISMDHWLGVPALYWDHTPEAIKRKYLYGKAGSFRPKPYGMEYRTLSCRWLMHPDLIRFVYQQTIRSIEDLFEGNYRFTSYARNIIDKFKSTKDMGPVRDHCFKWQIKVPKPPKKDVIEEKAA